MTALLAVTMCLPLLIALRISDRAGSNPPKTSTTISTAGLVTTSSKSVVNTPFGRLTARDRESDRTPTR